MKKNKKNHIHAKFWTVVGSILVMLLCAAPCGALTIAGGQTLNIGYGQEIQQVDYLIVLGTVNLYPGAYVDLAIYAIDGSTINIYGGELGPNGFIIAFSGEPDPDITVYGANFAVNGDPCEPSAAVFTLAAGVFSVLTGTYGNGDPINLRFFGGIPIYLDSLGLEVAIDITPGSNPNSINLKSKGVVPVAVLTTDEFDASTIDPDTVVFAGASPVRWKLEDVDGDGNEDMLFHFKTQELDLNESSTEATLTGSTGGVNSVQIHGTGAVRIVPSKKK